MIRLGGIYRFSSPLVTFKAKVTRRHDTGYWVIPYGSRKGFPLSGLETPQETGGGGWLRGCAPVASPRSQS